MTEENNDFTVYLEDRYIDYVRYEPKGKHLFIHYKNGANTKVYYLIEFIDWQEFCKCKTYLSLNTITKDHKEGEIKPIAQFSR